MRIDLHRDQQPPVLSASRLPITDPTEVHAGQWANVIMTACAVGESSIRFNLTAVQIIRDGADTDPGGARLDAPRLEDL